MSATTIERADGLLAQLSNELATAVERGGAATVRVNARRRLPATGVVWTTDNDTTIVVTSNHVVERDDDITITTPDGDELAATLVGRDPGSDLAVLSVVGTTVETAQTASDTDVRVGNLALALGRAGELAATTGVVSAISGPWETGRRRRFEHLIASDAPMFPGFSGGPLLDATGRVIGILSSHLGRGQTLAIPASEVDRIVATIGQHGRVRRGYLGIAAQPVALPESLRSRHGLNQERGLLLVGVEDQAPAASAGLTVGDIIVGIGETSATGLDELRAALDGSTVGSAVTVHLLRGGEPQDIEVTVGEQPEERHQS